MKQWHPMVIYCLWCTFRISYYYHFQSWDSCSSRFICFIHDCLSMCLSPLFTSTCLLPQAWLKERWCHRCSAATGCLGPTAVLRSSTTSWCRAGRTNLRTGPPSITCRVSWMTSTPPLRDSTSSSHRRDSFTQSIHFIDKHSKLYLKQQWYVFCFVFG